MNYYLINAAVFARFWSAGVVSGQPAGQSPCVGSLSSLCAGFLVFFRWHAPTLKRDTVHTRTLGHVRTHPSGPWLLRESCPHGRISGGGICP